MTREEIFDYVRSEYGTEPDYPWDGNTGAVLRCSKNKKWYGLIMGVERKHLGLAGDGTVDVLNVKCDPLMIDLLVNTPGFMRAYHMNKRLWVTILLDGTVEREKILDYIDWSYKLVSGK